MEEVKILNLISSKYTELGLVREGGTTNLRYLTNLKLELRKEYLITKVERIGFGWTLVS